jgi:DNA primase
LFFNFSPEALVVVEGFKACMWVWQAGIKNVVALLGTYLSKEQRWIIERIGAPVYLFLDNNDAGITGIHKSAQQLRHSTKLFVIEYPERLQEDDKAQPDKLTVEEIWEQRNSAVSYFDWKSTT